MNASRAYTELWSPRRTRPSDAGHVTLEGLSPSSREESDEALFDRYRQGEVDAFEALLDRYQARVYGFIRRMIRDRNVAEDLTQEVFLRVIRAAPRFRREARWSTWLFTIARNMSIDFLRKAHQRPARVPIAENAVEGALAQGVAVADEGPAVDDLAYSQEVRSPIARAVAALPDEQREVFLLREAMGMPFREIAAMVAAPPNTVKSRMRYALHNLRLELTNAGVS